VHVYVCVCMREREIVCFKEKEIEFEFVILIVIDMLQTAKIGEMFNHDYYHEYETKQRLQR